MMVLQTRKSDNTSGVFKMYFTKVLTRLKQRILTVVVFSVCILFVLSRYVTDFPLNVTVTSPQEVGTGGPKGSAQFRAPRWTYYCTEHACVRREASPGELPVSFDVCWLTCGIYGSLWPYPRKQRRDSDETVKFLPANLRLEVTAPSKGVKHLVTEAFELKRDSFMRHRGVKEPSNLFFWPLSSFFASKSTFENNVIKVFINVKSADEILTLATDESYEIKIYPEKSEEFGAELIVKIIGRSFYGVRHGIETFSQLVAFDRDCGCFQILKTYDAFDVPRYAYRGILLDSARNFIPMNVIQRVVDGMAYNKLNILHWHLTDSNSFPFHSKRVPQLTEYGTVSDDQIYYPHEVAQLVQYARIRGVKIIPELDAPSHAGTGWQFGNQYGKGDLAFYANLYDDTWPNVCYQPPCGILNPLNIHTYDVLEQVYADMMDLFDNDLFHMGGDEVNPQSWASRPEMREWLTANTELDLWKFFQTQALKRLRKINPNTTAILWTSKLTESESTQKYLDPKDYIIQVWEGSQSRQIPLLLERGFSLVMSFVDKFYLDWGMGTWLGREHVYTYHMWQIIYDAKLTVEDSFASKQILGGEAPLWGEKVSKSSLEVKLWPRAAALAENLWSNPEKRGDEVYSRINYHNHRLQQRGIPTAQLQPESCLHYNGHCHNPRDVFP